LESITQHCRSRSARIQPATSRPIMWFELSFSLSSALGTKSHSSRANKGAAVPERKPVDVADYGGFGPHHPGK
jgi:hypothetical protein